MIRFVSRPNKLLRIYLIYSDTVQLLIICLFVCQNVECASKYPVDNP
jgi:hypothetical protein